MSFLFTPDECDVEGCMINDPSNFPEICEKCIIKTIENIKNLPNEDKTELFHLFKDATSRGDYDNYVDGCCETDNITREEYREIEEDIWNEILRG